MDFNLKIGTMFKVWEDVYCVERIFKKHVRCTNGVKIPIKEVKEYIGKAAIKYVEDILRETFKIIGYKPIIETLSTGSLYIEDAYGIYCSEAKRYPDESFFVWQLVAINILPATKEVPEECSTIEVGRFENVAELVTELLRLWVSRSIKVHDIVDKINNSTMASFCKNIIFLINERCATAILNPQGRAYKDALAETGEFYGIPGLQEQVLYILNNGRWSNKEDRKVLEKFSKKGDVSILL